MTVASCMWHGDHPGDGDGDVHHYFQLPDTTFYFVIIDWRILKIKFLAAIHMIKSYWLAAAVLASC